MPWGEGPGGLPPLHVVDGMTLLQLVAETQVHEVVAADEVDHGTAQACWHQFVDLMRDVADSVGDLDQADRQALAGACDAAIADLRAVGVRVLAGRGGAILYVAVLPRGWRRDPRILFAIG